MAPTRRDANRRSIRYKRDSTQGSNEFLVLFDFILFCSFYSFFFNFFFLFTPYICFPIDIIIFHLSSYRFHTPFRLLYFLRSLIFRLSFLISSFLLPLLFLLRVFFASYKCLDAWRSNDHTMDTNMSVFVARRDEHRSWAFVNKIYTCHVTLLFLISIPFFPSSIDRREKIDSFEDSNVSFYIFPSFFLFFLSFFFIN